jgi:hypothetical protein
MTDSFLTPDARRFLNRLKLFLGLVALVYLIIGVGRIALDVFDYSGLGEFVRPELFSVQTLILGAGFALAGYFSLYTLMAVAAMEPPGLTATRNSLAATALVWWAVVIWAIFVNMIYLIVAVILALIVSAVGFWLWRQVERRNLWQVYGQPIVRNRERPTALYVVALVAVILLIALGVIRAILDNTIELPISDPAPGELLYTTNFADFNDEWDLPVGKQSAEVVEGELILESAQEVNSGFYARLDSRRFGDFDLRVRTRQISGDDDNGYGVVFRWRDFDNYYLFEISGDGFYRLSKIEGGIAEDITDWTPSTLVRTGTSQNEVRIVARDDEFTFYINQQLARLCTRGENLRPLVNGLTGECVSNDWLDHFVDDTFSQGKIGLSVRTTETTDVSDPVVIGFDNLLMIGPES